MSSDDITVKLTGPETWKPWNEELKKRAVNLRLWALINPDSPRRGEWMEEPTKPDITKYSKRLEAPAPRPPPPAPLVTGSASSASTQGTTQTVGRSGTPAGNSAGDLDSQASVVTPVTHIIHVPVPTQELTDPRGKPKTAEELTERAFKAYNLDLNEYYKVQAAYEKQHDNCYALSNWITKSVAPHYRSTSCKAEHTLDVWYEKLKIQVGTSTASQRLAALENYETAIKPLTKTPKNPMEWINNWEKALLEAQNEGVGSATDSILWWNALTKAMMPWHRQPWVATAVGARRHRCPSRTRQTTAGPRGRLRCGRRRARASRLGPPQHSNRRTVTNPRQKRPARAAQRRARQSLLSAPRGGVVRGPATVGRVEQSRLATHRTSANPGQPATGGDAGQAPEGEAPETPAGRADASRYVRSRFATDRAEFASPSAYAT